MASIFPLTGDSGISPIIIVIMIICAVVIIACYIWALVLNKKNSKIKTTVITVTDDLETDVNTVEDIEKSDGALADGANESTNESNDNSEDTEKFDFSDDFEDTDGSDNTDNNTDN